MIRYFLYGIFFSLIAVLLLITFSLIWGYKSTSAFIPQFIKEPFFVDNIKKSVNQTWEYEFAKINIKDYTPAVENFSLHFELDISELKEKSKFYQLIINKNSIYSMFCLKQVLNSFDVKYFLLRSGKNQEIFLDTNNKNLLENIVKELKKYNISTQVQEIWL